MATTAPNQNDDKATVHPIKEATESRVQKIKSHPATKRMARNTMRAGLIGTGYTILDEALNRTSFERVGERRVGVLWDSKTA